MRLAAGEIICTTYFAIWTLYRSLSGERIPVVRLTFEVIAVYRKKYEFLLTFNSNYCLCCVYCDTILRIVSET